MRSRKENIPVRQSSTPKVVRWEYVSFLRNRKDSVARTARKVDSGRCIQIAGHVGHRKESIFFIYKAIERKRRILSRNAYDFICVN